MLRAASLEDKHAVAHVLIESRRAFLPYAPSVHTSSDVLKWVEQHLLPTGGVTVAVDNEEVVAVLALSQDNDAAWVDQLYVLPGFENRGIGSDLLNFAHRSLRRPIRLFTFQQNSGSRRFYERHGYKVVAFSGGQSNEEKCPDVLYEFRSETEG
jgi:ribosomal protein S18 acetylase RimI-like enzyme